MKHLVITVHGIRTFGDWQERLEKLLREEVSSPDESLKVFHYKYGWFSVIAFLIPFSRWLVVRRFRKEFVKYAKGEDWDRIDMVGHSFGTHLIGWGLYGIRPEDRPRVHTIVLAGSVLKPGFPWVDLLGSSVRRLINDCGIHDRVLILNQIVVLFTGMAGRVGFAGMTGDDFRNRFFAFGHSGYFEDQTGRPDDTFMNEKWVQLILQNGPIPEFKDPRETSAVSGVVAFILNNLEPIKLTVYVAPLIALFLFYRTLYIREAIAVAGEQTARAGEKTQKDIAIKNQGIAEANAQEANKQRNIAQENATKAIDAQKSAEAKQREAEHRAYQSQIIAANQLLRQDRFAEAREILFKTSPQFRNWEWGLLTQLCGPAPEYVSGPRVDASNDRLGIMAKLTKEALPSIIGPLQESKKKDWPLAQNDLLPLKKLSHTTDRMCFWDSMGGAQAH